MNKAEVRNLLKKIQSNYPSFLMSEDKLEEWHKELKDYDCEDVLNRVDEHFRSEKYGRQEPRVYLLTKGLVKTKNKAKRKGIKIRCNICCEVVLLNEFDNHFDRCSSVKYLNDQNKKYFDKEIDKEKYMNMSDKEFNYKYDKFCEYILENTKSPKEREALENYFLRR